MSYEKTLAYRGQGDREIELRILLGRVLANLGLW